MADDLNHQLLIALPAGEPLVLRDVLEHQQSLGVPRDVLARSVAEYHVPHRPEYAPTLALLTSVSR